MLCPKCNKEMKVMAYTGTVLMSDNTKHTEIIGRCDDCDLDAMWNRVTDIDTGVVTEFNFRRYFFG